LKIRNYGYNCYVNVVLQLFYHMKDVFYVANPQNSPILEEIQRLFESDDFFAPHMLLKRLFKASSFKKNEQNDAH